jgi:4-amino-4-deoxy-L-arabinose transferase-like glycosyltransferase
VVIPRPLLAAAPAAAVLLCPPNLIGFAPYVDGGLPYVDFLTFYGPGQYYLTAALFWVFGENLLFLRLLHVASLAALALAVGSTAWQITRSEAAARWSSVTAVAVMLYAMPNAGYPAVLATLLLLTTVTVLESWERRGERWRLAAASSLAGLSGIFRWDFALYGLAALVLAVMIKVVGERDKRRAGASLGAALGPALGILFIV